MNRRTDAGTDAHNLSDHGSSGHLRNLLGTGPNRNFLTDRRYTRSASERADAADSEFLSPVEMVFYQIGADFAQHAHCVPTEDHLDIDIAVAPQDQALS